MYEVKLPQWGMNMTDGDIVKWLKQPNDLVAKGEGLVEIETAKATNVLESPVSGRLVEILFEEGATAPIQAVLAIVDQEG